jgi:hypothetical protein
MMLVGENRAWAEAVRQRCRLISDEIEAGTLPFDRPGPLIDEVLIGAALSGAQASLEDMPEIIERIAERGAVDDDMEYSIGDDDWDAVSDASMISASGTSGGCPSAATIRYSRPFWLRVTRSAGSTRASLLELATSSGWPV